jgi:hypothetical protein
LAWESYWLGSLSWPGACVCIDRRDLPAAMRIA